MNTEKRERTPKRIRRWFDRHHHLRRLKMLLLVLRYILQQQATGAVIMGNLPDPFQTSTIERTIAYTKEIEWAIAVLEEELEQKFDFNPRMTCYLTDGITPDEIEEGFRRGVWCAAKLYMADQNGEGGTTGSRHGVRNLRGLYPVFERMQKIGMPLLGHFEAVEKNVDEFDREIVSGDRDLLPVVKTFPGLIICVEHVTDSRMANIVAELPPSYRIYATVTPQGMMLNRNDLFWGGLNPINYCKPVPKREEHRLAIRKYVTSGNKRFGAGTDSAPHDEEAKRRPCGCAAGIFSAPNAVELYTTIFEEDGAPDEFLQAFLSENFVEIYGMKPSDEYMIIDPIEFEVPATVGGPEFVNLVHVLRGGTKLPWKLRTA